MREKVAGSMTPYEPVKPTPGALRAANAILEKFGEAHGHWAETCARYIDRETGAKAMYEALEELTMRDFWTAHKEGCDCRTCKAYEVFIEAVSRNSRAALRVARGE